MKIVEMTWMLSIYQCIKEVLKKVFTLKLLTYLASTLLRLLRLTDSQTDSRTGGGGLGEVMVVYCLL